MFKMSAVCSNTSTEALTPLLHCVVDDALVKMFPHLRNALLQLLHSPDLHPVDSLLELVSLRTADILSICCEWLQLLLLMLSVIVTQIDFLH